MCSRYLLIKIKNCSWNPYIVFQKWLNVCFKTRPVSDRFHDSSIPPRRCAKSSESVPKPKKVWIIAIFAVQLLPDEYSLYYCYLVINYFSFKLVFNHCENIAHKCSLMNVVAKLVCRKRELQTNNIWKYILLNNNNLYRIMSVLLCSL